MPLDLSVPKCRKDDFHGKELQAGINNTTNTVADGIKSTVGQLPKESSGIIS